LLEAAVGVTLALILPTGVFLAVAPFATGIIVVGLFAFTIGFSRWSRRRTEEAMSADFPEGGGSAFWWARFWLTAHRSRTAPAIDLSPSEG
jgi:hypothetical protein